MCAASAGRRGDTVYVAAADRDGNLVSLLNSLYFPFGSGLVVPGTGIVLQNRGYSFSLDPTHANVIAPGKRPFHTLAPAMLFEDGRPRVVFGVMGGNLQAQAHVQVVTNVVDRGDNVQEALDRPRFHVLDDGSVALEAAYDQTVARELAARGHVVRDAVAAIPYGGFGGGQAIMIDHETGTYWGASDSRKDGAAVGF
jgi:gamma-glutamyltranspeptidase/glutathione hydrolase